jgi:hypothetical protein
MPWIALVLEVAGASAAPPPTAEPWTARLFAVTRHDFGVVAKGANAEYRFVMENPYVEDVRIVSVESTCGCTMPRAAKTLLKTHESAEIIAELDTRRFTGPKEATIKVKFDQPLSGEVQLHVQCFIRSDVVFQPGSVQFGTVPQGQTARQRVQVSYSGRANWQIVGAASRASFLEARPQETGRGRDPAFDATQVSYDLWVTLKPDAPPGYFREQLILRTNDGAPTSLAAQVPLSVEGLVSAPLTINPSVLMLGRFQPRESTARNLVLRGSKPFRILEVSASDRRFRFNTSTQAALVHVMAVHFTADAVAGKIVGKIVIKTDLGSAEATVAGEVVGPDSAAKKGPQLGKPSGGSKDPPAGKGTTLPGPIDSAAPPPPERKS